jgi:hypothetical protein
MRRHLALLVIHQPADVEGARPRGPAGSKISYFTSFQLPTRRRLAPRSGRRAARILRRRQRDRRRHEERREPFHAGEVSTVFG